jgi:hypothetical protein
MPHSYRRIIPWLPFLMLAAAAVVALWHIAHYW